MCYGGGCDIDRTVGLVVVIEIVILEQQMNCGMRLIVINGSINHNCNSTTNLKKCGIGASMACKGKQRNTFTKGNVFKRVSSLFGASIGGFDNTIQCGFMIQVTNIKNESIFYLFFSVVVSSLYLSAVSGISAICVELFVFFFCHLLWLLSVGKLKKWRLMTILVIITPKTVLLVK